MRLKANAEVCLCMLQWQKQCVRLSATAIVLGLNPMSAAIQSVPEAALGQGTLTALWVLALSPLCRHCTKSSTSFIRKQNNFLRFFLWYRLVGMSITQVPVYLTALGLWYTTDRLFSSSPILKPCTSLVQSAFPNVLVSYNSLCSSHGTESEKEPFSYAWARK